MILNWFKTKPRDTDLQEILSQSNAEYEKEHREFQELIEDILLKLDEIKILIDEVKESEAKQ